MGINLIGIRAVKNVVMCAQLNLILEMVNGYARTQI